MGCSSFAQNPCPMGYSCQAPVYGSSLMQICCPTSSNFGLCNRFRQFLPMAFTATVCSLPIQPGNSCRAGETTNTVRFYYNLQSRMCQQFSYAGCGGNDNNFATMADCSQFCNQFSGNQNSMIAILLNIINKIYLLYWFVLVISTPNSGSCPDGKQQLPGVTCTANVAYSCPTGYVCQISTTNTAVCCLAPMNFGKHKINRTKQCIYNLLSSGTCPDGQPPFSAAGLSAPTTCSPSILASCPSSYSCVQSTTGQPICCPGAQNLAPQCPLGYVPYFS